jgi:hypothetical protein
MSKMLNTEHKIKVSEVLQGIMPDCQRTYFGYGGFCVREYVTLEALRGYKYDTEVTAFYVKVAARHGRHASAVFQQRIGGLNWRVDLAHALGAAQVKAAEYKKSQEDANASRARVEAARIEYATQLGEMIGRTVYTHKVNTDQNGPTGVSFTLTVNGTPEQVAEKFSRIIALSEEYCKNSSTL